MQHDDVNKLPVLSKYIHSWTHYTLTPVSFAKQPRPAAPWNPALTSAR